MSEGVLEFLIFIFCLLFALGDSKLSWYFYCKFQQRFFLMVQYHGCQEEAVRHVHFGDEPEHEAPPLLPTEFLDKKANDPSQGY